MHICVLTNVCGFMMQDRKALTLGPDDSLYVEGFASNVFAKADKQDRAGRADLYDHLNMIYLCIWLLFKVWMFYIYL